MLWLSSSEVFVEQLTRLKINKYRHIKPGTELHFNSGFNVLLGKNGTGKTTLLDLISIVISSDFSSLHKEEFNLEYEFDLAALLMIVSVRNIRVPHNKEVFPQPRASQEMSWFVEAKVHFKEENKWYRVTITPQESIVYEADQLKNISRQGDLFDEEFELSSELLFRAMAFRGWGAATLDEDSLPPDYQPLCRYDEALEIFELILGNASKKLRRQPPATISFTVRNYSLPEIEPHQGFHPVDLSEAIKERLLANTELTSCELTEKQVGFLAEFVSLIGASSIKATVSLDQRNPDNQQYIFKIREFSVEYPDNRYVTHEKLSYGQKRLLAFLYYLATNERFVIADELTDSFHHQWIEFCMEKLKTRQCFLSSQNPILLDYLPISSQEEAKKTFIQCRLEREGEKDWMVWNNLSDDDAREFFLDMETGVQHISEILMGRGLW
jgi:ABC-type lipoprotein export system ATPase subunit